MRFDKFLSKRICILEYIYVVLYIIKLKILNMKKTTKEVKDFKKNAIKKTLTKKVKGGSDIINSDIIEGIINADIIDGITNTDVLGD